MKYNHHETIEKILKRMREHEESEGNEGEEPNMNNQKTKMKMPLIIETKKVERCKHKWKHAETRHQAMFLYCEKCGVSKVNDISTS